VGEIGASSSSVAIGTVLASLGGRLPGTHHLQARVEGDLFSEVVEVLAMAEHCGVEAAPQGGQETVLQYR
jgi:hypothetical protein